MKIYIAFELQENASGGGNQFLKALKRYFTANNQYTNQIESADVVLFNSYQYINELVRIKEKYPQKIYVHRVDGPICLYNNPEDKRDSITNTVNNEISDATIFQSYWSKARCLEYGLQTPSFSTVIMNAPDSAVFFNDSSYVKESNSKIKIISTSWSSNINKGFDTYKWLDDNLDFNKFDYVFIGNSPIKFKNIVIKPPMTSDNLSDELRRSDIFVTASKKDPCSNSLIEAIHCGLYPVALDDGGHTEIVNGNGVTYSNEDELMSILYSLQEKNEYRNVKHNLKDIESVANDYANFFNELIKLKEEGKLKVRTLSYLGKMKIRYSILRNKVYLRFKI